MAASPQGVEYAHLPAIRGIVSRISAAVISNVAVISPQEPQLLGREFLL